MDQLYPKVNSTQPNAKIIEELIQLSRWVQSHLSDEQFKNISLLPFRVTIKSGRTVAETNVKYVVRHQHNCINLSMILALGCVAFT